jgi:hypothetical protein
MPEPALNFDIDRYINRFIPRPRLHLLPRPISWFLGYRSKPIARIGSIVVAFWSFLGAFAGLLVVEAVFNTKAIKDSGAPIVIASLVRRFQRYRNQFILTFTPGSSGNPGI